MWRCTFWACALMFAGCVRVSAQEPAAPPTQTKEEQQPATTAPAGTSSSKEQKPKYSHANDFVIRGTVFTDKAMAFPGVELRVRRAGDKKYKVRDYTNSRGEFAIRVPQGFDYEMLVHAKGFGDQTRTIDTKTGPGGNNLVFRMERADGANK